MEKQLKNWQQRKKLDLNELKLEVKKFNESLKYYQLEELKYQDNLNNKKEKVYSCQGTIEEKAETESNRLGDCYSLPFKADDEREALALSARYLHNCVRI